MTSKIEREIAQQLGISLETYERHRGIALHSANESAMRRGKVLLEDIIARHTPGNMAPEKFTAWRNSLKRQLVMRPAPPRGEITELVKVLEEVTPWHRNSRKSRINSACR